MISGIIDASHYNNLPAYAELKAAGVNYAVLKATQGSAFVDPLFAWRVPRMRAAGIGIGAYHFLDNSDPTAQADFFLATVEPFSIGLLAVDVEANPGAQATIKQAAAFATAIATASKRSPLVYIGRYGPTGDGTGLPDPVLSTFPLWLPKYGPAPTRGSLPAGWTNFVLWQSTDTEMFPSLPGVEVDGDCFNGDAAALAALFS